MMIDKKKDMMLASFKQLKAFSAQDGSIVGLLWVSSFSSYIFAMYGNHGGFSLLALALAVLSIFAAVKLGRRLSTIIEDGQMGFGRSLLYSIRVYGFASLLTALGHYIFFRFIDQGFLCSYLINFYSQPEMLNVLKQFINTETAQGLTIDELFNALRAVTPTQMTLNLFSLNLTLAFLLTFPTALLIRKKRVQ